MLKHDYDLYRVQEGKRWYRRKWQSEWDGCYWAQRGYTPLGVIFLTKLRMKSPILDEIHARFYIIVRRNITQRDWYQSRYDVLGRSYTKDYDNQW